MQLPFLSLQEKERSIYSRNHIADPGCKGTAFDSHMKAGHEGQIQSNIDSPGTHCQHHSQQRTSRRYKHALIQYLQHAEGSKKKKHGQISSCIWQYSTLGMKQLQQFIRKQQTANSKHTAKTDRTDTKQGRIFAHLFQQTCPHVAAQHSNTAACQHRG